MKPMTIEEVYNLRKNDEISIKGMLYKLMDDFDKENKRVLVCCYKDYPNGGFCEDSTYFLDEEFICKGLWITKDMKTIEYYVKKFQEYVESTEVFPPPCYAEKMDELYECYCQPYKNEEEFVKRAAKMFPEIPEADAKVIAEYLSNVVSAYIVGKVCRTYVALHRAECTDEFDGGGEDKQQVVRICKRAFPWISEKAIMRDLKFECCFWN